MQSNGVNFFFNLDFNRAVSFNKFPRYRLSQKCDLEIAD